MKRYHQYVHSENMVEDNSGNWVLWSDVEKARQQLKDKLKSVGCLNSCCGSGIFPIAYRETCKVIDEVFK